MGWTMDSRRGCLLVLLAMGLAAVATHMATGQVGPGLAFEVAGGTPAVVLLMRHAEKPLEGKDENLTQAGYARARALPLLFVAKPGSTEAPRFPRPDALFATAPSKHSVRPIETLTPLAKALNLELNSHYADAETGPLAREILGGRYAGQVVVICWHHGELPNLARALGVEQPPGWDGQVFDRIWKIEWVDGKARLTTLPEQLMPGDSLK